MKSSVVLNPAPVGLRAEFLGHIKALVQQEPGHAKGKTARPTNITFVHNLHLNSVGDIRPDLDVSLQAGPCWADALVDFYNRRQFQESLSRELSRAERFNSLFTLMRCRPDNGTSAKLREQVSIVFAQACEISLRGYDYVSRLANDEFFIILPEADRYGAQAIIQRMITIVDGALEPCTGWALKVGIACFPFDAETSDALLTATAETSFSTEDTLV